MAKTKGMFPTEQEILEQERLQNEFNKYSLTYCDHKGNPFMYLVGNQVMQNPAYDGSASDVYRDFIADNK